MSNYKIIGSKSSFKVPQPWIFKPVIAFRFKLIVKFISICFFIFLISFLILFLIQKYQLEYYFVIFTVIDFIYLIIVYLAKKRYQNSFDYRLKLLFGYALITIVISALGLLIFLFDEKNQRMLLGIVAVVTIIIFYSAITKYYNSFEFQVHGTEIIIKKGFFNTTENHIPFSNITNIAIRQGPFDQMLGIGSILVYTAGELTDNLGMHEVISLEGLRIYEDVGYFIIKRIKSYETFLTYLLAENLPPNSTLTREFWLKFLDIVRSIKEQLERN